MSTTTGMQAPQEAQDVALVLIADDEEPLAETVAFVVREAGYTPVIALHGREALEIARTRHPALLILDLMLPYVDGEAVIAALREDAGRNGTSAPPVVVMTGASVARARAAGADMVLRKPFSLEDLERALQRFLAPESANSIGPAPAAMHTEEPGASR
jgi:CheY-like chemotaxis protein